MVNKTLIHKRVYNIKPPVEISNFSVEKIADIISNSPKGLSTYNKYELDKFPVNFLNAMEGTRKDFTLHYSIKGTKFVYKDPVEFEGIKYYNTFSYEAAEDDIIKVDYVSFFTKPKNNINEHRIYQIGPRYSDKEEINLETLIRKNKKEGDIASTIKNIKKLLKIRPNDPKSWVYLGEFYVDKEQYDNAIEACKKAIELEGLISPAWIYLGMAYYGKGEAEKAKKLIKKMLEDDPGYLKALGSMAQIHFKEREFDKALEYCNLHIDYDYSDNKKDSKEIFKLAKIIKQKLGIQEEIPKGRSKKKEWDKAFIKLAQRLYDDNIEYIEYIDRSNLHNLMHNTEGKVIDHKQLILCKDAIINFFEKKFMKVNINPKLVLNLEVFYGVKVLINLITSLISNTKKITYIYIPLPFSELLLFISEWAFNNKEKKIVFYSFWEEEFFDKIYSDMNSLGNIQVRRLKSPYTFFVVLRDEKELILTPFSKDLEGLISIKSEDSEFLHFYKEILISILNEASLPINFEELKVLDNLNKFLDDLPKNP